MNDTPPTDFEVSVKFRAPLSAGPAVQELLDGLHTMRDILALDTQLSFVPASAGTPPPLPPRAPAPGKPPKAPVPPVTRPASKVSPTRLGPKANAHSRLVLEKRYKRDSDREYNWGIAVPESLAAMGLTLKQLQAMSPRTHGSDEDRLYRAARQQRISDGAVLIKR